MRKGPVGDGNMALVEPYFRRIKLTPSSCNAHGSEGQVFSFLALCFPLDPLTDLGAAERLGYDTDIVAHNGWVMETLSHIVAGDLDFLCASLACWMWADSGYARLVRQTTAMPAMLAALGCACVCVFEDWPATEDFAMPSWRMVYLRRHLCVLGLGLLSSCVVSMRVGWLAGVHGNVIFDDYTM